MRRAALAELERLHISIPSMNSHLKVLSGGQRQAVAIARAVAWASKLVIMDEPTAALGPEQQGQVLDLIREVRDQGIPILMVSHSLQQVMNVADRIAAFRHGDMTALVRRDETTQEDLIAYITGLRRQTPIASQ
jgi:ABC-type sugar transport system ATPase subunit